MIISFEMHIIYCVTIIAIILLRLRMNVGRMSAFESIIGFTSTEASTLYAENSEVLALSSCLGCLVDSDFFGPSSNWRERQCKFLSDWQQICCVFNKYLRKYYRGAKKYRYCARNIDKVITCVIYLKVYEIDFWL
jgi:hypothetical protein